LQLQGIGPRVSGRLKEFVEIVLKHVGWVVDPPDETKEYFDESREGGFGVIRITIQDEPA
jgi:hypothetical protein